MISIEPQSKNRLRELLSGFYFIKFKNQPDMTTLESTANSSKLRAATATAVHPQRVLMYTPCYNVIDG
jgi:hypothetical protein